MQFERTKTLIGEKALQKLANSHIAIFGIGGVGGYVAEALIRAGIGRTECLRIRVHRDEFYTADVGGNHTVYSVVTAATDTDYLDVNAAAKQIVIKLHVHFYFLASAKLLSSCYTWPRGRYRYFAYIIL